MSNIKAVLWDLDSTLLDPRIPQRVSIQKCFKAFGFGVCTEEQLDMFPVINNKLWFNLYDGTMTKQQIVVERFTQFLKFCGKDYSQAEKFNDLYMEKHADTICPCPHALETVRDLRGKVYQGIVTNGMIAAQQSKIVNSELDKLVDEVFISEAVGYDKPQKEFLDYVIQKIGITDRNSVMIVGDALESDIQCGNNAGILTCWYNPEHIQNSTNLRIDYEISDIAQVLNTIEQA